MFMGFLTSLGFTNKLLVETKVQTGGKGNPPFVPSRRYVSAGGPVHPVRFASSRSTRTHWGPEKSDLLGWIQRVGDVGFEAINGK